VQERGQERETNRQMGNGLRPVLLICLFFFGRKRELAQEREEEKKVFGERRAANDIHTAL